MNIPRSSIPDPNSFRLGIFGGSFDPVHRGHLLLAECCREQAELDAVWFVPTAGQPLKPQGPQASDVYRRAMLELAIEARPEFQVSTIELDRGGVSYTIDTLEAIRRQEPEAELFFLMGADSLAELPQWHRAAEIVELALPRIVHRAGTENPDFQIFEQFLLPEQVERIRQQQIKMPATLISSSQIRKGIVAGEEWQDWVPPTVADYIRKHHLYGA